MRRFGGTPDRLYEQEDLMSALLPNLRADFALSSLHVAQGRALDAHDEDTLAAVAVIGGQVARELFPDGKALGQPVKVNHVWLDVVGVLADRDLGKDQFEGVQLGGESNRIYVPLASAHARFKFDEQEDEVDRILLRLADPEGLAAGARVWATVLDQRHAGVSDYTLVVPQQLLEQHQKTQRIFQVVMGAIAGVSLLVGGIGISGDVVAQFLREASVICAAGALLGLLFGTLLAYLIAAFAGWQVAWAPLPILLSAAFCAVVGMAFGVYPARQAAKLDPIAALRHD